jgi:ornithine cyclodeaminase/alanine dehydrogenase-like protein (mu-crystallin family)
VTSPVDHLEGGPLLLDEHVLASLLDMRSLIDLMARTLSAFSAGRVIQPVRHVLELQPHGSFLGVMPAFLPDTDSLAVKLVSFAPRNATRGLPTHLASVLLFDPRTGALLCLMDGRLITEMRTAAVSAVSARVLAREDARTLAVLGSGVQAASHLRALEQVRSLAEVRVWSRTPEHAARFARERPPPGGPPIRVASSPEEAVRGADLIVTATASRTPVLEGRWIGPGAHVMSVGASQRHFRELDGEAVRRARVFVDSLEATRVEAGDLIAAEAEGAVTAGHVCGELGEAVGGTIPGRTSQDQITLFKSVGIAVEDAATAQHAYQLAVERGVGLRVTL